MEIKEDARGLDALKPFVYNSTLKFERIKLTYDETGKVKAIKAIGGIQFEKRKN